VYRIILCIFQEHLEDLLNDRSCDEIQIRLNESYALKASRSILNQKEQRLNEQYWAKLLDLVEHGVHHKASKISRRKHSFKYITEEHIVRLKKHIQSSY